MTWPFRRKRIGPSLRSRLGDSPRNRAFLAAHPSLFGALAGLPALLATAGLAGLCAALTGADPQRVETAAWDRAGLYFAAKDYKAAQVGFERGPFRRRGGRPPGQV